MGRGRSQSAACGAAVGWKTGFRHGAQSPAPMSAARPLAVACPQAPSGSLGPPQALPKETRRVSAPRCGGLLELLMCGQELARASAPSNEVAIGKARKKPSKADLKKRRCTR